jgi:colanic acid biosynthesis glycosyl transferase WcaI
VVPGIVCASKIMADPRPTEETSDTQSLNILYLSQYFHPEQFLNNHIAKALVAADHRVDVVTCVPNYPAGRFFDGYSNAGRKEELWEGVHIHRVFTIPRGRSAIQLIANYLAYPVTASWRIRRLMKTRRPDVSFVSMPSPLFQALAGIFAKRFFGVPTIYWVQDIWPDSAIITLKLRNRAVVWALNKICGWIYRQADIVMVQSDGFHRKIAEFGVNPERIVTLPNAAPDFFKPISQSAIPQRIRAIIPEGRRILMFAGNIGESQDFNTIIAAAQMLPPENRLLIVVIGSGRDEARVKKKVEHAGLNSRFLFLGRHSEVDMPAFFACADAMFVSLRDEPIFSLTVPSKVQAYLACGKPILANLAGEGAAIIERSRTGIATPPGSPKELAESFFVISNIDDVDLQRMSDRALHLYEERFSLPSVVEQIIIHSKGILKRSKLKGVEFR